MIVFVLAVLTLLALVLTYWYMRGKRLRTRPLSSLEPDESGAAAAASDTAVDAPTAPPASRSEQPAPAPSAEDEPQATVEEMPSGGSERPRALEDVPPVDTQPPASVSSASVSSEPDDLKVIKGIGPKIASVLQDAGILTYAQLAQMDVSEIEAILEGEVRIAFPETWPEQARFAAAGDWEGLEAFQNELTIGRR